MGYSLPTIVLGRTGQIVTRLGTGGAYCQTVDGYRQALDCGVTYVDTARVYQDGEDEKLVGQAIAGRRDGLTLSTKSLARDAAGARKDLETSLRALGTDHVDVWHLHGLDKAADREQALAPGGAYEAALKAREQGLIRFIGLTGHDWAEVAKGVETGLFDVALCWYSCAFREPEELLFPATLKHGTAVTIMQATRVDKLLGEPDQPPLPLFYRYVLAHPAVHVVLRAIRSVELFQEAAKGLSEGTAISAQERAALEAYGRRMREAGKLER